MSRADLTGVGELGLPIGPVSARHRARVVIGSRGLQAAMSPDRPRQSDLQIAEAVAVRSIGRASASALFGSKVIVLPRISTLPAASQ